MHMSRIGIDLSQCTHLSWLQTLVGQPSSMRQKLLQRFFSTFPNFNGNSLKIYYYDSSVDLEILCGCNMANLVVWKGISILLQKVDILLLTALLRFKIH